MRASCQPILCAPMKGVAAQQVFGRGPGDVSDMCRKRLAPLDWRVVPSMNAPLLCRFATANAVGSAKIRSEPTA